MAHPIDIQLNGELCHVAMGTSMVMLLRQLELDERGVVVELNRKIIRRTEMESLFLDKEEAQKGLNTLQGWVAELTEQL